MNVAMPASSSLQRTDEVCSQVEKILAGYESLEFVTSIVGRLVSLITGEKK